VAPLALETRKAGTFPLAYVGHLNTRKTILQPWPLSLPTSLYPFGTPHAPGALWKLITYSKLSGPTEQSRAPLYYFYRFYDGQKHRLHDTECWPN